MWGGEVRSPFLYRKSYEAMTKITAVNREQSKPEHSDLTRMIFLTVRVVSQFIPNNLGKVKHSCDICTNKFNTQSCTYCHYKPDNSHQSHLQHNFQKFYANSKYRNNTITGYSCCLVELFCTTGPLSSQ